MRKYSVRDSQKLTGFYCVFLFYFVLFFKKNMEVGGQYSC